MNLVTGSEGQKKVPASAYYKQQQKLKARQKVILNGLKEQKIDSKLIGLIKSFFCLEDERKGKGLALQKTEYLEVVTSELEAFVAEGHKDPAPKLFRLFVRMNFNKEVFYKYYRDRLDQLLAEKGADAKQILNRFTYKCSIPVRDDIAYNPWGNLLREDMIAEIQNRGLWISFDNEDFKPVNFEENSGVIGAMTYAMIESSFIKRPVGAPFYRTLSRFLRGPNGPFGPSTYKNTITNPSESCLLRVKEILIRMNRALDERLEHLKR